MGGGLRPPRPLPHRVLVVGAELAPALLALTEAPDEGADPSLGHQEGGGERIGPPLRQLLPVLGAAHEPAAIAVDEDVAVLVHTREHTASQRVVVVHDDRWPVPAVAEE